MRVDEFAAVAKPLGKINRKSGSGRQRPWNAISMAAMVWNSADSSFRVDLSGEEVPVVSSPHVNDEGVVDISKVASLAVTPHIQMPPELEVRAIVLSGVGAQAEVEMVSRARGSCSDQEPSSKFPQTTRRARAVISHLVGFIFSSNTHLTGETVMSGIPVKQFVRPQRHGFAPPKPAGALGGSSMSMSIPGRNPSLFLIPSFHPPVKAASKTGGHQSSGSCSFPPFPSPAAPHRSGPRSGRCSGHVVIPGFEASEVKISRRFEHDMVIVLFVVREGSLPPKQKGGRRRHCYPIC
jgi:hypothetical protein